MSKQLISETKGQDRFAREYRGPEPRSLAASGDAGSRLEENARLGEYADRRASGAHAADLNTLRRDLLATPHPTVWEEMKRQSPDNPEIGRLFANAPEALGWGRMTTHNGHPRACPRRQYPIAK